MPGAHYGYAHMHGDERSEEFSSGQALKDNGYFYPGEADTVTTVRAQCRRQVEYCQSLQDYAEQVRSLFLKV